MAGSVKDYQIEVFFGVSDKVEVFERISIDQDQVGIRTFLNDPEWPFRIWISWARESKQLTRCRGRLP